MAISQFVGLALLIGLALLLSEPLPPASDVLWGGAAGLAGGAGLVALYHGLASGPMGLVAPVAAVVQAAVPLTFGLLLEGLPGSLQILGFGLALVAVWLVSRTGDSGWVQLRAFGLPLAAGLGFGIFLILIGRTSSGAILWPLVSARFTSTSMLVIVMMLARQRPRPDKATLPLMLLAGLFDSGGNAFYALAAQAGRLDTAAVLGSLYPAATVLLARFVLKERLSRQQWIGVIAAWVAVVFIAL